MKLERVVRNMVLKNMGLLESSTEVQLNENKIKLDAIVKLKEIQAQLTGINFLEVISVMSPENPLKKSVEAFEVSLGELRQGIESFVVDNQFDTAEEVEPEESGEEDESVDTAEPEDESDEEEKTKDE